jgi:hypothetical protein
MRDLACVPVQHIREEQDGPLAGREELKDGEEGERDALAPGIERFRVVRRLGQPAVREGFQPGGLGASSRKGTAWTGTAYICLLIQKTRSH